LAAARALEQLAVAQAHLFERLQAIDGEAGTDDVELLHALPPPGLDQLVGVRREPLLRADARLERDLPFVVGEAELACDQRSRPAALCKVRVPLFHHPRRHAVEGEEEPLPFAVSGTELPDA